MSLKIITFANHKGGVSKTTSTASIGACMARMGKKVLLIDLDGQANLTLYFIPNEDEVQASIFDSLVDGAPLAGASEQADQAGHRGFRQQISARRQLRMRLQAHGRGYNLEED